MRPRIAFAALLCGALLVAAGCGGGSKGKPIPASQANRLIRNIQAADQYAADGRCSRAHTKVRDARFVLGQVPDSVDADLRQGLADGLARMDSLISEQCQPPQNTATDTTPTETTQTETTHTETTLTETTPTEPQPTETLPPTTTTPTTTTPTQTNTSTTTTGTGGTPPGQANGGQGNEG